MNILEKVSLRIAQMDDPLRRSAESTEGLRRAGGMLLIVHLELALLDEEKGKNRIYSQANMAPNVFPDTREEFHCQFVQYL